MPGELCMPSRKDYKRPLDHINTVATLGSNFVLIFSICTPPIINLVFPPPPPPPPPSLFVPPPPPPLSKFYTILSIPHSLLERPITFAPRGFRDILEPEK